METEHRTVMELVTKEKNTPSDKTTHGTRNRRSGPLRSRTSHILKSQYPGDPKDVTSLGSPEMSALVTNECTKQFTNIWTCPRLCAAAVSLLLGRIGRWSGREIACSALSLARSAQAERDNESCFFVRAASVHRFIRRVAYDIGFVVGVAYDIGFVVGVAYDIGFVVDVAYDIGFVVDVAYDIGFVVDVAYDIGRNGRSIRYWLRSGRGIRYWLVVDGIRYWLRSGRGIRYWLL
ncbi:hypothetical protein EVAR_86605_1 [Eumeta japonica]|uniref:Uncharacterized protein n=1 Tax=Eumeta variegata TaxID=151549 RepID=A0A4C1W1T4_EUMVA|nr:hypothetical protein EVAR_86605_1 [Eumeta japonica]